jgi:hypothetical protein
VLLNVNPFQKDGTLQLNHQLHLDVLQDKSQTIIAKNVKDAIKIILILYLDSFVKNAQNTHFQMQIGQHALNMILFFQKKV